jgi:hypothetical protein
MKNCMLNTLDWISVNVKHGLKMCDFCSCELDVNCLEFVWEVHQMFCTAAEFTLASQLIHGD